MARYHTRLRAALLVMGVWWVIVMAWGVWMPLPEGLSMSDEAYADDSWVKRVIYRLQEFSGLSSF